MNFSFQFTFKFISPLFYSRIFFPPSEKMDWNRVYTKVNVLLNIFWKCNKYEYLIEASLPDHLKLPPDTHIIDIHTRKVTWYKKLKFLRNLLRAFFWPSHPASGHVVLRSKKDGNHNTRREICAFFTNFPITQKLLDEKKTKFYSKRDKKKQDE